MLRAHLATVREEVEASRSELVETSSICIRWASRTEANRQRLRRLREEEAEAASGAAVVDVAASTAQVRPDPGDQLETEAQGELEALRAETDTLAQEVSDVSALQIARCRALRNLRATVRLTRARRDVQAAAEHRQRAAEQHSQARQELEEMQEVSAGFRARARGLREEVAAQERHAEAARATIQSRTAAAEAAATACRAELAAEARRESAIHQESLSSNEAKAELRRRVEELSQQLSASRVGARRLASALREAEGSHAALASHVGRAGPGLAALKVRATVAQAARLRIEAELQQQRDATLAWRSSAGDLAMGHREISEEASRAAEVCRELLMSEDTRFGMRELYPVPALPQARAALLHTFGAAAVPEQLV